MKTIKRILMAGMLVISLSALANEEKVITSGDVTITQDETRVDVSILNTQENTYTLYIYNPNGELVFKERLGNETSLGKRFDFDSALKGNYKFTFVTGNGERTSYTVRTGLKY
jgi:flagellar hook assembly protein FlgD